MICATVKKQTNKQMIAIGKFDSRTFTVTFGGSSSNAEAKGFHKVVTGNMYRQMNKTRKQATNKG